ncbi:signal peptidase I [Streptomyces sp. 7N604]|uniref:signal peptidase I n=1 Tax=Streptomyces sp. 7N604 TaxID=3457415 RepID=UPI003FCFBE77
MDTDAQLSERDRSSGPGEGREQRSRSLRIPGRGSRGKEAPKEAPGKELPAKEEERPSWLRRRGPWRRAALLAGLCAVFLGLLSACVVQPFLIPSGSMEPTLRAGDRVLVNKLAYRFGDEPRRGDVVVFDGTGSFDRGGPTGNPVTGLLRKGAAAVGLAEPDETEYVKRVVGIGGDRVTCCDERGRITVNGQAVDEEYLYPGDAPSQVPFDIVVPGGKLWMMGDHRSESRDSRDHLGEPGGGMVPVERVIGRADWISWPYDRWAELEHSRTRHGHGHG